MVKNKLVENAVTMMRRGYDYYSLEQAQRLVKGVEPVHFGTGFKNKEKSVYVVRGLVYKLWKPTYKGSVKLFCAIQEGFYDKNVVPALLSIIFNDDGVCCGYVMRKCRLSVRGKEVGLLLDRVCKNSKKFRWFHTDFIQENVGVCPETKEPTLLDLDSVARVTTKKIEGCRDFSYKKFLKGLTFSSDSV